MKLRTRITAVAALVILLASAVSDGVIWMICRRALMNEAQQTALREIAVLNADFERFAMQNAGHPGDGEIAYFLKLRADDYVIALRREDILFNQTVLSPEDLYALKASDAAQSGFPTAQTDWNGHLLLIARAFAEDGVTLCRITDLSAVSRRLRQLALGMCGVLLAVGIPAVLVLWLLLRRTLHPLQTLSDSAKQIAAGAYDERAAVCGSDEIGLLAQNFNLMAEAVQEKITALAESEQRKTMFMADFSHELKTPLTAISGYAQTLRTVKLSDDDRAEALGYIYSESRRLDRLAKKMMRLMQLDRTESLQMLPVDNCALLDAVLETCQPIAAQNGVALAIAECTGSVCGDFDLLHDTLCNLTDNAVKASNAGQTVTLSAKADLLTVRDEGCGIPPEEIKNLTEPFYTVDKSRSRKSGGAGLGLAIVRQIIGLHGAEMRIESTPGKGTTVRLHFIYTPMNT